MSYRTLKLVVEVTVHGDSDPYDVADELIAYICNASDEQLSHVQSCDGVEPVRE